MFFSKAQPLKKNIIFFFANHIVVLKLRLSFLSTFFQQDIIVHKFPSLESFVLTTSNLQPRNIQGKMYMYSFSVEKFIMLTASEARIKNYIHTLSSLDIPAAAEIWGCRDSRVSNMSLVS